MRRSIRSRFASLLIAAPLVAGLTACGHDSGSGSGMSEGAMGTSMNDKPMSDSAMGSPGMGDGSSAMADMPFGAGCSAFSADGPGSTHGVGMDPFANAASHVPGLSKLTESLKEAGLTDSLNSAKDITVFAPSNEAFAAMPMDAMDKAMADPAGKLSTLLKHHVVEGKLPPEQIAGEHKTLAGDTLEVTGSGTDFKVANAKIVCGNVHTANANIYVVDQVITPMA